MSKMIQLRNVPDDLHRAAKVRAALEGLSLSDYLTAEIRKALERPSLDELRRRLHARSMVTPLEAPAEVLRRERDGR